MYRSRFVHESPDHWSWFIYCMRQVMSQLHQAGLNAFVVDAIDGDAFTSQDRSVLDCRNLRELWAFYFIDSYSSLGECAEQLNPCWIQGASLGQQQLSMGVSQKTFHSLTMPVMEWPKSRQQEEEIDEWLDLHFRWQIVAGLPHPVVPVEIPWAPKVRCQHASQLLRAQEPWCTMRACGQLEEGPKAQFSTCNLIIYIQ